MLSVLCALNQKVDCLGRLVCVREVHRSNGDLSDQRAPVYRLHQFHRIPPERPPDLAQLAATLGRKAIRKSSELRRTKRSEHYRTKGRGVRSCYCKLRSSFPATISEEKLDFVCNCRRAEQPILLFKAQHKHADADSYLPTGSIRTATTYRSRYYRTGNRREPGRAKHGWFEGSRQHETFERQRRKRKRGRNRPSTSDDEIEPPTRETSESIKELVLNESDPNEAGNERICSCDSQGCVGNCEQLSGCVCSDSDRCWGS